MTRLMRKLEMVKLVQREAKALLKLSPWLLLSLLLAAVLWSTDLSTTSGLFQSPPEPATPVVTPTLTLTPTPTLTPTLTLTPAVELTATMAPVVSPTVELTVTTAPVVSPTVSPLATDEPGSPEPFSEEESQRYAEEDASLSYEWGMFFDSAALMISYAWLCCGVLVFVAIPVAFGVLWVAARRRQQD